jgi:hypothetical protein
MKDPPSGGFVFTMFGVPKGEFRMAKKNQKFLKASKAKVKIKLGKKNVMLSILVPENVARNLARRLHTRFPDA